MLSSRYTPVMAQEKIKIMQKERGSLLQKILDVEDKISEDDEGGGDQTIT